MRNNDSERHISTKSHNEAYSTRVIVTYGNGESHTERVSHPVGFGSGDSGTSPLQLASLVGQRYLCGSRAAASVWPCRFLHTTTDTRHRDCYLLDPGQGPAQGRWVPYLGMATPEAVRNNLDSELIIKSAPSSGWRRLLMMRAHCADRSMACTDQACCADQSVSSCLPVSSRCRSEGRRETCEHR